MIFFHWLCSLLGPWSLIFFSFMIILQTAELLGRVISSSQGLCLNTGKHKHRINTCTYQTSMQCMRFEPTIPASERAKTVHALDLSATVTSPAWYWQCDMPYRQQISVSNKLITIPILYTKLQTDFIRVIAAGIHLCAHILFSDKDWR
jgi:hypothetical protein